MKENIDEIDAYNKKGEPTEAENVKQGHWAMEKASINPTRRKLLRLVGVFGKTEEQLKEESELNDFFFKFHMDLLLNDKFLKLENGMHCLTDTGISLHDSVC